MDKDITTGAPSSGNIPITQNIFKTEVDNGSGNDIDNVKLKATDTLNAADENAMQYMALSDTSMNTSNYVFHCDGLNIPYKDQNSAKNIVTDQYKHSEIYISTAPDVCVEHVAVDEEGNLVLKTSTKSSTNRTVSETSKIPFQFKTSAANSLLHNTQTGNSLVSSSEITEGYVSGIPASMEIPEDFNENTYNNKLHLSSEKASTPSVLEQSNLMESDHTTTEKVKAFLAGRNVSNNRNKVQVVPIEEDQNPLFTKESVDYTSANNRSKIGSLIVGDSNSDKQLNAADISDEVYNTENNAIVHSQSIGNNYFGINSLKASGSGMQEINQQEHEGLWVTKSLENASSEVFKMKLMLKDSNLTNAQPSGRIMKSRKKPILDPNKPLPTLKQFHMEQKLKMLTDFKFPASLQYQKVTPSCTTDVKAVNTDQNTILLTRTQPHPLTTINMAIGMIDVPQFGALKGAIGSSVAQKIPYHVQENLRLVKEERMEFVQGKLSKTEHTVERNVTPKMLQKQPNSSQTIAASQSRELESLVSTIVVVVPPTSNWAVPLSNTTKLENSSVILSQTSSSRSVLYEVPAKITNSNEAKPLQWKMSPSHKDTLKVTKISGGGELLKPIRTYKTRRSGEKPEQSIFPIVENLPNGKGVRIVSSSQDLMATYKRLSAAVPVIAQPVEVTRISIPHPEIYNRFLQVQEERKLLQKTLGDLGKKEFKTSKAMAPCLISQSSKNLRTVNKLIRNWRDSEHSGVSAMNSRGKVSQKEMTTEAEKIPHFQFNSKILKTYANQKISRNVCLKGSSVTSLKTNEDPYYSTKIPSTCHGANKKYMEARLFEDLPSDLSGDTETYNDATKSKNLLRELLMLPVCGSTKNSGIHLESNKEKNANSHLAPGKALSLQQAIIKDFEVSDDDLEEEILPSVDMQYPEMGTEHMFSSASHPVVIEESQPQPFMPIETTEAEKKKMESYVAKCGLLHTINVAQPTGTDDNLMPCVENADKIISATYSGLIHDDKNDIITSKMEPTSVTCVGSSQHLKDLEYNEDDLKISLSTIRSLNTVCADRKEHVESKVERGPVTSVETSMISSVGSSGDNDVGVKRSMTASLNDAVHLPGTKSQEIHEDNICPHLSLESSCGDGTSESHTKWETKVPVFKTVQSLVRGKQSTFQDESTVAIIPQDKEETLVCSLLKCSSDTPILLQKECSMRITEQISEGSQVSVISSTVITTPVTTACLTRLSAIGSSHTYNATEDFGSSIGKKSMNIPEGESSNIIPAIYSDTFLHEDSAVESIKDMVSDELEASNLSSIYEKTLGQSEECIKNQGDQNATVRISSSSHVSMGETDIYTAGGGTVFTSNADKQIPVSTNSLNFTPQQYSVQTPKNEQHLKDNTGRISSSVSQVSYSSQLSVDRVANLDVQLEVLRGVQVSASPKISSFEHKGRSDVMSETQETCAESLSSNSGNIKSHTSERTDSSHVKNPDTQSVKFPYHPFKNGALPSISYFTSARGSDLKSVECTITNQNDEASTCQKETEPHILEMAHTYLPPTNLAIGNKFSTQHSNLVSVNDSSTGNEFADFSEVTMPSPCVLTSSSTKDDTQLCSSIGSIFIASTCKSEIAPLFAKEMSSLTAIVDKERNDGDMSFVYINSDPAKYPKIINNVDPVIVPTSASVIARQNELPCETLNQSNSEESGTGLQKRANGLEIPCKFVVDILKRNVENETNISASETEYKVKYAPMITEFQEINVTENEGVTDIETSEKLLNMVQNFSKHNIPLCLSLAPDMAVIDKSVVENVESEESKPPSLIPKKCDISVEGKMSVCGTNDLMPSTLSSPSVPALLLPSESAHQQIHDSNGTKRDCIITPKNITESNIEYYCSLNTKTSNIGTHTTSAENITFVSEDTSEDIQQIESGYYLETRSTRQEGSEHEVGQKLIEATSENLENTGKSMESEEQADQHLQKFGDETITSVVTQDSTSKQPDMKHHIDEGSELENGMLSYMHSVANTGVISKETIKQNCLMHQKGQDIRKLTYKNSVGGGFINNSQLSHTNCDTEKVELEMKGNKMLPNSTVQTAVGEETETNGDERSILVFMKSGSDSIHVVYNENTNVENSLQNTDLSDLSEKDSSAMKSASVERKEKELLQDKCLKKSENKADDSKEQTQLVSMKTVQRNVCSENMAPSENTAHSVVYPNDVESGRFSQQVCSELIKGEETKEVTQISVLSREMLLSNEIPSHEDTQNSKIMPDKVELDVDTDMKQNSANEVTALHMYEQGNVDYGLEKFKTPEVPKKRVDRRKQSLGELRLPEDFMRVEVLSMVDTKCSQNEAGKTRKLYRRRKCGPDTERRSAGTVLGIKKKTKVIRTKSLKGKNLSCAVSEGLNVGDEKTGDSVSMPGHEKKPRKLIFESPSSPEISDSILNIDSEVIKAKETKQKLTGTMKGIQSKVIDIHEMSSDKLCTRRSKAGEDVKCHKGCKTSNVTKNSDLREGVEVESVENPYSPLKSNTENSTHLKLRTRIRLHRRAKPLFKMEVSSASLSAPKVNQVTTCVNTLQRTTFSGKLTSRKNKVHEQTASQVAIKGYVRVRNKSSSNRFRFKSQEHMTSEKALPESADTGHGADSPNTSVSISAVVSSIEAIESSPGNPLESSTEEGVKRCKIVTNSGSSNIPDSLEEPRIEGETSILQGLRTNLSKTNKPWCRGRPKKQKVSPPEVTIKERTAVIDSLTDVSPDKKMRTLRHSALVKDSTDVRSVSTKRIEVSGKTQEKVNVLRRGRSSGTQPIQAIPLQNKKSSKGDASKIKRGKKIIPHKRDCLNTELDGKVDCEYERIELSKPTVEILSLEVNVEREKNVDTWIEVKRRTTQSGTDITEVTEKIPSHLESCDEEIKFPNQASQKKMHRKLRKRSHQLTEIPNLKVTSEDLITASKEQLLNDVENSVENFPLKTKCAQKELDICVSSNKKRPCGRPRRKSRGGTQFKEMGSNSEDLIATFKESTVKDLENDLKCEISMPDVNKLQQCGRAEKKKTQLSKSKVIAEEALKGELLKDVVNSVEKSCDEENNFLKPFSPLESESSVVESILKSKMPRLQLKSFVSSLKEVARNCSHKAFQPDIKAASISERSKEYEFCEPEYECLDIPHTTLLTHVPPKNRNSHVKHKDSTIEVGPKFSNGLRSGISLEAELKKQYKNTSRLAEGSSEEINVFEKEYEAVRLAQHEGEDCKYSSDAMKDLLVLKPNDTCFDLPKSSVPTAKFQEQEPTQLLEDTYALHVNLLDIPDIEFGSIQEPKWPSAMKEKKCYGGKKRRASETIGNDEFDEEEETFKDIPSNKQDIALSPSILDTSARKKCYPGKRQGTEAKSKQEVSSCDTRTSLERKCCRKQKESEQLKDVSEELSLTAENEDVKCELNNEFAEHSTNVSDQISLSNKVSSVNLKDTNDSVPRQNVHITSDLSNPKRQRKARKKYMEYEMDSEIVETKSTDYSERSSDIGSVPQEVPDISGKQGLSNENGNNLSITLKINENFKSLKEECPDETENPVASGSDSSPTPIKSEIPLRCIKKPVGRQSYIRSSGRPFHIPPHLLGRSVNDPTSDVTERSRPMQRPRMGVRVPYRNLTSQIVTSKEIVRELLERSKARNTAIAMAMNKKVADCVGKTFTKYLSTSLARLPMTPEDKKPVVLLPPKIPAAETSNNEVWHIGLQNVKGEISSSATTTFTTRTNTITSDSARQGNPIKLSNVSSGSKKSSIRALPKILPMDKEMERAIALKQLEELPSRKRKWKMDDGVSSASVSNMSLKRMDRKKEVMPAKFTVKKPCRKPFRTGPLKVEKKHRKVGLKRKK